MIAAEYTLRAALLADTVIAGLVAQRFYPHDSVPQEKKGVTSWPALTYQRFERDSPITLDRSEMPSGPRIQFNAIAQTSPAASALARELRRFFRGGYSAVGIQLAQLAGGGVLPRDPDSELFGYRVDVLVTLDAAEVAA